MQKFSFIWLLACLLWHVHSADPQSSSRWQRGNAASRAADAFRPQPSVVRVENYRYLEEASSRQESGGIPEQVGANADQIATSSTKAEGLQQTKSTPFYQMSPLQRIKSAKPFDDVDRLIFATALPLSAVFAIIPIASALDLFWVNRLGDALAVAGQSAANQVYNSAFWLFAFLPTITATLVSKSHASGDIEKTQDSVCQAMLFALLISIPGALLMFFKPTYALGSILKAGSPALETARPYLKLRAFSFIPMMISFVGFSTFRGTMEVASAVKITMGTTILAATLDPLLIHVFGFGVRGAALAGLAAEYTSAGVYLKLLLERNFLRLDKLTKLPAWSSVAPLIKGSVALQLRSFALNLTQLMVARVIQSIDDEGVAPAAHALALQTFQLGGIMLGALGMATQTLVPSVMAKRKEEGGQGNVQVDALVKRLLRWGVSFGLGVSVLQMFFLPQILSSSPLAAVRDAARTPALISIAMHALNAVVNIGEGTMIGCGNFVWVSVNIVAAALGYMGALQVFPQRFGLSGVWFCVATFTIIRLIGSLAFLFAKIPKAEENAVNKAQ